jgi:ELWxxDGT repeat protein
LAATPELLRDVNQTSDMLGPESFAPLGSLGLFAGRPTGADGPELFRTDGTKAGTVLVKDIVPGLVGSSPANLLNVGGTVYFAATGDGVSDRELWKSDGSTGGTVRVRDINPGAAGSGLANFTDVNGTLYFTAFEPNTGTELWKSNGTEAGTVRVTDMAAGPSSINPQALVNLNGTLLFVNNTALYRLDANGAPVVVTGAPAGVQLPTKVGNFVYFTAGSGTSAAGVYRTSGTTATLVKALGTGTNPTISTRDATASGSLYYFSVRLSNGVTDLWRSDGTSTGTFPVRSDVLINLRGALVAVGTQSVLFNHTTPEAGREPWVSDGTVLGTKLLKDTVPGAGPEETSPGFFGLRVGSLVYFTPSHTFGDTTLWKTDGTPAGTAIVRDVAEAGGFLAPMGVSNGMTYWNGFRLIGSGDLYRSDGTAPGTVRVGATTAGNGSSMVDHHLSSGDPNLSAFFRDGDTMYFAASDGDHGQEVWRTDPAAGAVRMTDIAPGGEDADPYGFARGSDGSIYFNARTAAAGSELYRLPPGGAPAQLVRDLIPGPDGSGPSLLTPVGDVLYFNARASVDALPTLWRFNPATNSVIEIRPSGNALEFPTRMVQAGGYAYFGATAVNDLGSTAAGAELWRLNAADPAASPTIVADVNTGSADAFATPLAAVGTTLFFAARDTAAGNELWKTDGTTTVRVADLTAGSAGSFISAHPANDTVLVDGLLYFIAGPQNGDSSLWRTDGTADGTDPVVGGVHVTTVRAAGGHIYFIGYEPGVAGGSVYRTDGGGGAPLRLTQPGTGDTTFRPAALHAAGGHVYAIGGAGPGSQGNRFELWRTGSAAGSAELVLNLQPRIIGPVGMSGYFNLGRYAMASDADFLYFPAYQAATGREPYRLALPALTGTISGAVYDDVDGDGTRDAGEAGIGGVTVFLDADADGVLDAGETAVASGAGSGAYVFEDVQGGQTYRVATVAPAGYAATAPANGRGDVQVGETPATLNAVLDFGYREAIPPRVTAVFAGGTTWAAAFNTFLASSGQGEAQFGFRVRDVDQLNELPWTGINRVSVRFSEPVTVAAAGLVVRGVNVPAYAIANGVSYDAATFTATWTLSGPLKGDKVLLDLDDAAVTDGGGNALDGEWTDPLGTAVAGDTFASGDGAEGGDFRFRVHALPGDANRNGTVQGTDVTLVRAASGATPGQSLYSIFKDVDGNGVVQAADAALVRERQGHALPAGSPIPRRLGGVRTAAPVVTTTPVRTPIPLSSIKPAPAVLPLRAADLDPSRRQDDDPARFRR